jgi:hypothetical protein
MAYGRAWNAGAGASLRRHCQYEQLYFTAGPDDEQNGLFGRLELP